MRFLSSPGTGDRRGETVDEVPMSSRRFKARSREFDRGLARSRLGPGRTRAWN